MVLVVAVSALCVACEVDTRVDVRVAPDGSGTVTARVRLDRAAVAAAEVGGGTLDERVRLADLVQAGWTLTPWTPTDDGGAAREASKPFATVDEVGGIVAELTGPDGPISAVSVAREEGTWSTTTSVTATLDASIASLGIADDAELAARLATLGIDPAAVDGALAAQARDAFGVRFAVELPDGVGAEWTASPDDPETVGLVSTVRDTRRIALVVVGGALAALALYLLVVGERRAARRRRRARAT